MKIKLNKRELRHGIEELKRWISNQVKPFKDDTSEAQKARIESSRESLFSFAKTYFPHYLTIPPSKLHMYLYEKYTEMIKSPSPKKLAIAAPRGNAKSTITSLILPLWCICYGLKHFIAIFSNSFTQAAEFLEFIKAELESNERLKFDFPDATDQGSVWQYGHIITKNGVKVRAWGVRQKLLGARHLQWRPDLCIYDDLEDPEELVNPENRKKTEKWFFDKAFNIGNINYTDHIAVGTIHHQDCLLKKLINRFGGKIFRSVIRWSESPLWQKWEEIYLSDSTEDHKKAYNFFKRHKKEMLAGTEVLWPEGESYYDLMCLRVEIGPAAFDSAKQNDPSESSMFSEEWLEKWAYDEADIAGKNLILFGSCDPSMGKDTGAPSAIIILARESSSTTCYVLVADIRKRHPSETIRQLIEYQRQFQVMAWAFEIVQLQEYMRDQLLDEASKEGIPMPVYGIRPTADKDIRIQSLQPYLMNGTIRLPKKMMQTRDNPLSLWNQLKNYPNATYKDGPDALEMAFSIAIRFSDTKPISGKPRETRKILQGYWG